MSVNLKERCHSCNGHGYYFAGYAGAVKTPCWECCGKGWTTRSMDSPDPKWARLYQKGVRYGETKKAVS